MCTREKVQRSSCVRNELSGKKKKQTSGSQMDLKRQIQVRQTDVGKPLTGTDKREMLTADRIDRCNELLRPVERWHGFGEKGGSEITTRRRRE